LQSSAENQRPPPCCRGFILVIVVVYAWLAIHASKYKSYLLLG
jgi:hypothetical protein